MTRHGNSRWCAAAALLVLGGVLEAGGDPPVTAVKDFAALPANTWTLIAEEDADGGKAFARLIAAESIDRLYLWGLGGKMPDASRYVRYELESFSPADARWTEALPESMKQAWAGGKWQPFRIYGQMGTDGPRTVVVGGGTPNIVRFFPFEGINRPSPVHTFNQACWDSTRSRIVYYDGGMTFALDPAANTWTDLAPSANPIACGALVWASQCYDPINDEVLLFGGGEAFNLEGGARTWLYDCRRNAWYRPQMPPGEEPPLRCTSPIVFDPTHGVMVMFGGYDQSAALNDTWVYRCKDRRWEKRLPAPSPPPMFDPAAASLPGGFVLVCGANALVGTRTHGNTWDNKETWVYDIAHDTWRPAGGDLKIPGARWLTATESRRHGVAFMAAIGQRRLTYAFRYDPSGPASRRTGAPPGTVRYKYYDQKESLEGAPPADLEAHRRFLAGLPANQFIDARPPGLLIAKTWSSATIDTDRGEVIYAGGGHSGYSGNDIAHYSVAANRWSLDAPPRFPPYLEGATGGVYGWSYGRRPWSQHTYLWYGYDPVSRKVLYCARPCIRDGTQVLLDEDPAKAFLYDRKTHGNWTYVYDPAARKLSGPFFGRPFENPWDLSLVGTSQGLYAAAGDSLYRASVSGAAVEWKSMPGGLPAPKGEEYHHEWQPIVFDPTRNRLLYLVGTDEKVEVRARPLDGAAWEDVPAAGRASIGRDAFVVPRHDVLLMLSHERLFVLNLAKPEWRELDLAAPKGNYGHEAAFVYDPGHDVCILLLPSRFSGPLQTFLLRFDPRTATYKTPPPAKG